MNSLQVMLIPSSVEGEMLNTLIWKPEQPPRALLLIVHGMAEHIARYDEFARFMSERGVVTAGCSHLGHGSTAKDEKALGFIAKKQGWQRLCDDQARVRAELEKQYPNIPVFVLGQSMGSFLVRTLLTTDYAKGLSGAIIAGTGWTPGALLGAGRLLAGLTCFFRGGRHRARLVNNLSFGSYNKSVEKPRTEFDWLSRNEQSVDRYVADPRCGFVFTASAYKAMFGGISYNQKKKNLRKMRPELPLLFICGDKDPVGANGKGVKTTIKKFENAGAASITLKLYEGDRHETLNELNREQVHADVFSFIHANLGGK